jgi:murein DD-endopeptidase MepM/ murein hydrolase activator NlpD
MEKKKKIPKQVSVLIVPNTREEPISFTLKSGTLRLLKILGLLLFIHIIAGGVFYWQYAKVRGERNQLLAENKQLKEENKKIYDISAKFAELSRFAEKLKASLGVNAPASVDLNERPSGSQANLQDFALELPQSTSGSSKQPWNGLANLKGKLRFIAHQKSLFQDVFDNRPTLLPVDGFLTLDYDTYNNREFLNRERHIGIDIAAKIGTVVKAAGRGEIIFANWTPELGNLVIIYHGDDIFSYYAHNERILKTEGFVSKGEPIALLGSSGLTSSGPHLHFEIWQDGAPVDPKKYLLALQ